ncbi:MAG: tyrosine-type recombinase/integrase [Candidatus Nanopelagicales bacterium]|nr:tyrosine-type recombinase/integrase [Candidatus Nanopelagicales bacterium]
MSPRAGVAVAGIVGDLLGDYGAHVEGLDLSAAARCRRLAAASRFMFLFPDLQAWMARPTAARVEDLRRSHAWPLLVFAISTGRLRLDLELAGAKKLHGLGDAIRATDPAGFERAGAVGLHLGWGQDWIDHVLHDCLPLVLACTGRALNGLDDAVIDRFDADLRATVTIPATVRRAHLARLASLRRILFEMGISNKPPARGGWGRTLEQRFADVDMASAIRVVLLRYVQTRAAVLRPASIESLANDLLSFAEFLTSHHSDVASLRRLHRGHIEEFLTWNRTRTWRGAHAKSRPVGPTMARSAVLSVRSMFEDIAMWGWAEAPGRQLVFAADIPKLGTTLPRALSPNVDATLMTGVADLADLFAATGLQVLRGTGLRIGELLDLECDSVIDYGPAGIWLRVPLGKLNTERAVPLNQVTLAALDTWAGQRGEHRPIPHPRTGRLTHFLFTQRGRRLGEVRLRNGLVAAALAGGLSDAAGNPLRVTPHQLRHTYATELANAGVSLQALMALLGHVTSEMTVRYASLAPATVASAYGQAVSTLRPQLAISAPRRAMVPDKITWLNSEMIKTRLASGYCTRHEAAGACAYANICETCDNFTPATEFADALAVQLADTQALQADAAERGWAGEVGRHQRTVTALQEHLKLLRPR